MFLFILFFCNSAIARGMGSHPYPPKHDSFPLPNIFLAVWCSYAILIAWITVSSYGPTPQKEKTP